MVEFFGVFALAIVGWWALGSFIDRLCDLGERLWARFDPARQDDRLAAHDFANADWERTRGAVGWPAFERAQDERVRQAVLAGYDRRREHEARLRGEVFDHENARAALETPPGRPNGGTR